MVFRFVWQDKEESTKRNERTTKWTRNVS